MSKQVYQVIEHPTTFELAVRPVDIVAEGEKTVQLARSHYGYRVRFDKATEGHLLHWTPADAVKAYRERCDRELASAKARLKQAEEMAAKAAALEETYK